MTNMRVMRENKIFVELCYNTKQTLFYIKAFVSLEKANEENPLFTFMISFQTCLKLCTNS